MDISEVKRNLNKPVQRVSHDGEYILTGCIIRKGPQGYWYQAELFDQQHGNSVVIVRLDEVISAIEVEAV